MSAVLDIERSSNQMLEILVCFLSNGVDFEQS